MSQRKPEDVRQAKQIASTRYLELLVEVLKDFDKGKPAEELASKVNLSLTDLRLQHFELEHFENMKESFETYKHALRVLQDKAFRMLKVRIKISLHASGVKKPSIKMIQRLALRHHKYFTWLPKDFKASKTWAANFRLTLIRTDLDDKRVSSNYRKLIKWCQEELEGCGRISNSKAKQKYVDLYGLPPKTQKAWSDITYRLRRILRLKCFTKKIDSKLEYFWKRR